MSAPLLPPRGSRRVADEIYRILQGRIISGELQPGARIDIDALAAELEVSRTPVREAVLQLDSAGLVERKAYRGTIVTGVDEGRLEEITALRISLEGLATELGTARIDDRDIDEMERIQDEIESRGDERDFSLGLFNDLNAQFHNRVFAAAQSPTLLRLIADLGSEADRIRLHFSFKPALAHVYHREIIAACRARDAAGAALATRKHLLAAYVGMRGGHCAPTGALAAVLEQFGLDVPDGVPQD